MRKKTTVPSEKSTPNVSPRERFDALSSDEAWVTRALAVVYIPVRESNVRDMLTWLRRESMFDLGGAASHVKETLAALESKGLAVKNAKGLWQCDETIVEIAARAAQRDGLFAPLAKAAEDALPVKPYWYYPGYNSFAEAMRSIRTVVYTKQPGQLDSVLQTAKTRFPVEFHRQHPLVRIACNPFDPDWLDEQSAAFINDVLFFGLDESFAALKPCDTLFHYLEHAVAPEPGKELNLFFCRLYFDFGIFLGKFAEVAAWVQAAYLTQNALFENAMLESLRGNWAEARVLFADAMTQYKKETGKRKPCIEGPDSLYYTLALLQSKQTPEYSIAEEYLKRYTRQPGHYFAASAEALLKVAQSFLGMNPVFSPYTLRSSWESYSHPMDLLFRALAAYWLDVQYADTFYEELDAKLLKAANAGYQWWAAEAAVLLQRVRPVKEKLVEQSSAYFERTGTKPLVEAIRRHETWERNLDALERIAETMKKETPVSGVRLAWHVTETSAGNWHLEPREVKRLRSGAWSKGKSVSLRRLCSERDSFPYLTDQDHAACGSIEMEIQNRYYGGRTYFEIAPRAFLALVGHPMVFFNEETQIEVVKGDPELRVTKKDKDAFIELAPTIEHGETIALVRETFTRLKVVEFRPEHQRIADILQEGLRVPLEHKERVLEALSRVAAMITIHSDIGGELENVPEIPADPRPRVILLPSGDGLRAQLRVRPLGASGAYYHPGTGGASVMGEIEGKPFQTHRDLDQERALAAKAVAACPSLELAEDFDNEWLLADPELCLEFLDELRNLGENAVVEWPEGEKMRVSHNATFGNLKIKISSGRNWFEATGELVLDENNVLGMRQLLELLDKAHGRFVPIGEGQYLSLTKEFRKRLDELRALSEEHGKGVRFHPLAAPAIEGILDGVAALRTDKAWEKHLERFREAQTFTPELPTTLRATLRDYQLEGFHWLARLERWGAGACLADDMGLGKTVQALTAILSLASEGPSLVVAPTSVCMNWADEVRRFTPTLTPILFGAGDRQATLDALGPFDLLICSYGLLHQDKDKLAAVRWRAAVLDEAQAIKNIATRRSQAAMSLQADFRVITTGTPIENHLGELWNLFRFINPGLLGSIEQFNTRFAAPIEKYNDKPARNHLKRILQPFILRRLKEKVLEELPSRTEILLHVEFSEAEAAFYEALRQQALEKIAKTPGAPGQKHLRILAEIMRLRRACCNADLVTPGVQIPSSKLAVFLNLVEQLMENRHKALVFSQFVDHLSILRKHLDQRGIHYQYLDGSTPQKERAANVAAFQAGQGDLFLISLKAGGLGLNLTAADYVIHMDPWWNPAVEDQASDRAHRIGQQRPVTIYRLVTKDTIESKIVELHAHKRDLADKLLEGSDSAGRLSADELLELLREER